jgi:hypothetical protein
MDSSKLVNQFEMCQAAKVLQRFTMTYLKPTLGTVTMGLIIDDKLALGYHVENQSNYT